MSTLDIQHSQEQVVVLSITLIAFSIGELSQAVRVRRVARDVDLRGEVSFRLVFLTGILMVPLAKSIAPAAAIRPGAVTLVVGAVLAWLGFLLRWWSFLALGPYFTLVLKTSADQTVVDRGPYRVLRHPSYSGLLLAVLGCALAVGNWVGLVTSLPVVFAAIAYRIRIEERALTANLGDSYRAFATSRARLVPFVW